MFSTNSTANVFLLLIDGLSLEFVHKVACAVVSVVHTPSDTSGSTTPPFRHLVIILSTTTLIASFVSNTWQNDWLIGFVRGTRPEWYLTSFIVTLRSGHVACPYYESGTEFALLIT